MKILPTVSAMQAQSGKPLLLSLAEGGAWTDALTMGQILKARVLRQLSEGRYQLDFGGQSRVVDSAIPLSVGDVLYGKIVGLSGQVILERVQAPRDADAVQTLRDGTAGSTRNIPLTSQSHAVDVAMSAAQQAALSEISRAFPDPILAARIGRFLARLGIPLSLDLVRLRHDGVSLAPHTVEIIKMPLVSDLARVPHLHSLPVPVPLARGDTVAAELAKIWLRRGEGGLPENLMTDENRLDDAEGSRANDDENDGSGAEQAPADLFRHLLNAQTGAVFQHRFQTLPVVIDGRLIEFYLALFDHQAPDGRTATRSRRIHMDLQTGHGVVQLDVRATGERVSMVITTENEEFALALESFRPELARELGTAGWALEHADYFSGTAVDVGAAEAVIAHVLAQDSLGMVI